MLAWPGLPECQQQRCETKGWGQEGKQQQHSKAVNVREAGSSIKSHGEDNVQVLGALAFKLEATTVQWWQMPGLHLAGHSFLHGTSGS